MPTRGEFDEGIYRASLQGLVNDGVPESLARQASEIVASDDPTASDFGRTEEQQHIVSSAMTWYRAWRNWGGRR
jgi:hypothetical protein